MPTSVSQKPYGTFEITQNSTVSLPVIIFGKALGGSNQILKAHGYMKPIEYPLTPQSSTKLCLSNRITTVR